MPLYTYQCETCQIEKDIRHAIGVQTVVVCNNCNSEMKRMFVPTKNIHPVNGKYTSKNNYGLKSPKNKKI